MAKYQVTFSCGHAQEMQLVGPHKERERKIAYFEKSGQCSACFKAAARAEDAQAEAVVTVKAYSIGAGPMLACQATGKIEANKKALKQIGFRWSDEAMGFSDFLSLKPTWNFVLTHAFQDSAESSAWLADLKSKLHEIGYRLVAEDNLLDSGMFLRAASEHAAAAAERQRVLAAHPKPERPAWYEAIRAQHANAAWNGKFYGKSGAWRIYVSNTEYRLSDPQYDELAAYLAKLAEHRKAIA